MFLILHYFVRRYYSGLVDGNWFFWSARAPCSLTCAEGLRKRLRNCINPAPANGGKPCKGIVMETKSCRKMAKRFFLKVYSDKKGNEISKRNCVLGLLLLCFPFSVHGSWSFWSTWTPCSKTCGVGFQKRVRDCKNPAPVNGGKPCKGVPIETKQCSVQLCPGLDIYKRINK